MARDTSPRPTRIKMKELERRTGVGRETIRFYIREGLLPEPERPARNVAWYDESFVERIRLIKELQHKRFLPLSVIKAIVGRSDVPTRDEVEALLALDGRIFPAMEGTTFSEPERLSQVAKRLNLPAAELRQLAAIGAIDIETRDGGQWLDETSIRIVDHWAHLREAGFTSERGLGPEKTRLHLDFVEWLAREELRIFGNAIAGKISATEAARMAEAGIEHINQILNLLRRRTLLRYIGEGNMPDDASEAYPASHPRTADAG